MGTLTNNTTLSQCKRILDYLQSGKTITALEALDKFGCFRLASRISDLKSEGWNITSTLVYSGDKRYAEYKLIN